MFLMRPLLILLALAALAQEQQTPVFRSDVTMVHVDAHVTDRGRLVAGLAKEISRELKIPFRPILKRTRHVQEQKLMQNEAKQAQNVIDSLELVGKIPRGPVLLIDDIIDSGWTLSMAGYLLRQKGSGPVYPFALAQASTRKTK